MKRIIILGAVVALVIVAWTGAWFWIAGMVGSYAKELETADGVTTPRVTCQSFQVSGYPFGLDTTCSGATIVMADTTVTVSGIKTAMEVYNPFHVLMFAQAPVAIADAFTGSQSRVDFADAEASARLTGWRIGRISLVVDKPVWNDTLLDDRLLAKADKLEVHLMDVAGEHDAAKGTASLAEYAKVSGLDAPAYQIAGGEATFEGKLTGLSDDVRTYGDADAIRQWQQRGGRFTLVGFKGQDATAQFDTAGNLSLDAQGRAEGQFTITSKGVVERLGGMVPDQMKGLILGSPAQDGSYSQTINIRAGLVFAGLLPAAMIPPAF
jgi:hypothetical protein